MITESVAHVYVHCEEIKMEGKSPDQLTN